MVLVVGTYTSPVVEFLGPFYSRPFGFLCGLCSKGSGDFSVLDSRRDGRTWNGMQTHQASSFFFLVGAARFCGPQCRVAVRGVRVPGELPACAVGRPGPASSRFFSDPGRR